MPAPKASLQTSGNNPVVSSRANAEAMVDTVSEVLYEKIEADDAALFAKIEAADDTLFAKIEADDALEAAARNALGDSLRSEIAAISTGLTPAGNWSPASGSFPAGAAIGTYYVASAAGTVDGQAFAIGDWLIPLKVNPSTSVYATNWFRGDYSKIVPRKYADAAEVQASLEPSRGINAIWDSADGLFKEVATGQDFTTAGGVKLLALDTVQEAAWKSVGGRGAFLRMLSRANRLRQKVVVVGDSITEQAKAGTGNGIGYVTYLAEAFPGITFVNEGIGGNTTLDVINRLSTITAHQAAGYILAIGVNDARYNDSRGATSLSAYVTNVTTIINAFKAATGYKWSSIISIWPTFWKDQFANLGRKRTDERIRQWNGALESNAALNWQIPYANAHDQIRRAVNMSNVADLIPDGVHPDYDTTAGKRLYAAAVLRDEIRKAEFRSEFIPTGTEFYKIRVLNTGSSLCEIQNIKLSPYHKDTSAYSADPNVAINGLFGSYSAAYTGYKNRISDYPFEILISADQLPSAITTVSRGLGKGIRAFELYRSTDPDAAADPAHHSWQMIRQEYSTAALAFNLFPKVREGVFYRVEFADSDGTDGTGGTTGTYVKVKKIWGGVEPVRYAYANMLDLGGASERFDLYFSAAGGSASAYMANVANTYPLNVMIEAPHQLKTLELASVGETGRNIKNWKVFRSFNPAAINDPAHASWTQVASGVGDATATV